jgi:AcrR family transcriptional regulator
VYEHGLNALVFSAVMVERPMSERLGTMPRGRHLLPADFVARNQRARILLAACELVAEQGYRQLTIEAIAKRARVALLTFYENFPDKEQCFLAAFDESLALAGEAVGEAVDGEAAWPTRLAQAIEAFLELAEAEPARARACLLESQGAGDAGLARYMAMLELLASHLREGRELSPDPAALPDALDLAAAGGLAWLAQQRLAAAEIGDRAELARQMLEAALTLYLGPEQARRAAATT